jgi:thymidine phosphorylase
LVIDLKVGSGAFMRDVEAARELAHALLAVATLAGKKCCAVLTDMGQPLGQTIGHALECAEALDCLRGAGPDDVRELSVELCVEMGVLAGLGGSERLRTRATQTLTSGAAYDRFLRMAVAQGADRSRFDQPDYGLSIAPMQHEVLAPRAGFVHIEDAAAIGLSLLPLHGARATRESNLDLSTGLRVLVRQGQKVAAQEPLVRIHTHELASALECERRLAAAITIVEAEPSAMPLVLERVTAS